MKIALVHNYYTIPGGQMEFSEYLLKGLRDLWHEVEFILLDWITKSNKPTVEKKIKELKANGYLESSNGTRHYYSMGVGTGCYFNPVNGHIMEKTSYKTDQHKNDLIKKLDSFDHVIWQDIGGFNQKCVRENDTDWVKLFQRRKGMKQIAIFHDHNALNRYPWFEKISKHFDFLFAVHPASFSMAMKFGKKVAMAFNPQDMSMLDRNTSHWDKVKDKQLMSIGAWKTSKRFHEVVRAIPWIDKDITINMCGGGLEHAYMNSEEKCKDCYLASKVDPDAENHPTMPLTGNKVKDMIWKRAETFNPKGFQYHWPINASQRDALYAKTSFLIDPAWYKINFKIGSHFSRVLVEGMKHGIVPIARNLGLSNNEEGIGEVFKAGENYLMIPWDATPKQFGEFINKYVNETTEEEYNRIVQNNYDLLEHFNYIHVAEQYIKALEGKEDVGFYQQFKMGKLEPEVLELSDKMWYGNTPKTFSFKR